MSITRNGCVWQQDGLDGDTWETSCKHFFMVIDDTPTNNGFKYCVFCGRPLVESLYSLEDDE